jgi:hypothetical protein
MNQANCTGKLLFESEAEALAYLDRHYPAWQPCPTCCAHLEAHKRGAPHQGPRGHQGTRHNPPPPLTDLQRAYHILGLLDTVILDDAVAMYRNKMKSLHPDKGGSHEKARELT